MQEIRSDTSVELRLTPTPFSWSISFVGIVVRLIAAMFIFVSIIIFASRNLRASISDWALASLIAGIIINQVGKIVINGFGAKYLTITKSFYEVNTPFGNTKLINKNDIANVSVFRSNSIIEKLGLSSPSVTIITYEKITRFRVRHWKEADELLEFFDALSKEVYDEFALYYHRSNYSFKIFVNRFMQDTLGMIGVTIVLIYVFLAIWGAYVLLLSTTTPYYSHTLFLRNPEFGNYQLANYDYLTAKNHPPSREFWFGTDFLTRDIFARVVYGTTYTFMIAMSGLVIVTILMLFFGITSAYFPGWWDNLVTRISDTLLTFPPFIILILISTISMPIRVAIPGGYFLAIFTGMGFFIWPAGARMIRTEIIEQLNKEYVLAAKQLGASNFRILFYHILPKILPIMLIILSYTFTDIIIGTSLLGYIGFDAESTLIWGSDISKAVAYSEDFRTQWYTWFFPTFALFFLVLGLTLLTDAIKDVLEERFHEGLKTVPYELRLEGDE